MDNINKKLFNEDLALLPRHTIFKYKGFTCVIKRHPVLLSLGGYVLMPTETHFKENIHSVVDVHGGITFVSEVVNSNFFGHIFGKKAKNREESLIIGFDCAHYGDYVPGYEPENMNGLMRELMGSLIIISDSDVYRNKDFVEQQLKSMVDQLIDLIEK